MRAITVQPEFRSLDRLHADEEIADAHENFLVVDATTGWSIHGAIDERLRLSQMSSDIDGNNAIAIGGLNSPFLWNGNVYRINRASFADGKATVEVSPTNAEFETELCRRIESAPHHVLTFYQGFGFICFVEDHSRYQDFKLRNG